MFVVLVGLVGFAASFLSNISGGDGALILLPALISLGIPPLTAIGTIKVSSVGLVAGSLLSSKDKGIVRKEYVVPMLLIVTLASFVGPRLALNLSNS